MNLERLVEALHQLSHAPGKAAAARILEAFPFLTNAETDAQLTRAIGFEFQQKNMPNVCWYTAVRGFLRRYKDNGPVALAQQPDWSLAGHSPLAHMLALTGADEHDQQLKWSRLALQDLDAQTEPELYGLGQYRLGLCYLSQTEAGDTAAFVPAIQHLTTAVHTLSPLSDETSRSLNGRARHNLAQLYLTQPGANRRQNVEEALNQLEKAQVLLEASPPALINVLLLQGNAYLGRIEGERLHNIERGIHLFQQAHALARRHDLSRLHEVEHNLAVAYRLRLNGRRADNYEQALTYARQALQHVDQAARGEAWAKTTLELAIIFAHRQKEDRSANLEQAITLTQQTLDDYYRPDDHPYQWSLAHLTLGNLFCDRLEGDPADNYRQAIVYFEAVEEARNSTTNPIGWAEAINNLGTAYAGLSQRPFDDNYQQAVDYFQQALAVYGPDKLPDRARRTAVNQGNLAFRYRQWAEALDAYQKALNAGDALYRASGTQAGRQAELAENAGLAAKAAYCWLQLDPPQPDKAFQQLEEGKTRLLVEALSLRDVDLAGLPKSWATAVKKLRQEIGELEAEMRLPPHIPSRRDDIELGALLLQKRESLNAFIADIRQTRPDFLKIEPAKANFSELIPPDGAVIAPLITAQGSVAFVIPHGTEVVTMDHVVPLPHFAGTDLARLLQGWITAYRKRVNEPESWVTAVTNFTHQLWPDLIQPIAARLIRPKCQQIIFLPQGGLQLLPLHAAWYAENGRNHYLIDDFEISYAPSLSVLAMAQKRRNGRDGKKALIAGVNKYESLPNLRNAVYEAEQIAETFNTVPLLNEAVTKQAILAGGSDQNYLHLACHGSFNWEDALESALYLANDESLTLNNIMSELNLEAMRLVTLSACETGITEFSQLPDEFIGLPAGFIQTGASGVVNSLWAVDDNSTAFLMLALYHYLLEEHFSPAAAFKKAQAWLRQNFPQYETPYFWGAFTFYGA